MLRREYGLRLASPMLAEHQKLLSYGHVVSRNTNKAVQYHGARFGQTINSLRQFLIGYAPNQYDESLTERVNWMNQAEYFLDAKSNMDKVLSAPSIIHLIEHIPVICRTLTIQFPLPAGLQMNVWLVKVTAMPTILSYVTTLDFFAQLKNKTLSHGENVNSIMLVTKDPGGSLLTKGIGKHLASYLLTRNANLFYPDADLSMWAAVSVFILNHRDISSWMLDELNVLCAMHKAVYSSACSWTKYMKVVASDEFVQSLVSKCDNTFLSCPHLNKFILAVFFLQDLNLAQLEARRDAAIVEFFSRLKIQGGVFTTNVSEQSIYESVDFPILPTMDETTREFKLRVEAACRLALRDADLKLPDLSTGIFEKWNLSPVVIERVFQSMARLRGFDLSEAQWMSLVRPAFSRIELVDEFVMFARKHAGAYAGCKFFDLSREQHRGLPVLVTRDFAARFQANHGRDLIADLDINNYGLSRCACMYPTCPFFAQPMGAKLKFHLAIFGHIKGVHRAVLTQPDVDVKVIVDRLIAEKFSNCRFPWVTVEIANRIRDTKPYWELERLFL